MAKYAETYSVSDKHRTEILREVKDSAGIKPWDLMDRVDAPKKALKRMVLDWELTINHNGDVIVPQQNERE